MKWPRPSIRGLMIFIVVTALGFAALRSSTPILASVVVLATVVTLGLSVLAAVYRKEERRAHWLGFAIFGLGYVTLAYSSLFGPGVSENAPRKWREQDPPEPPLTTMCLMHLKDVIKPDVGDGFTNTILDEVFADRKNLHIRRALERPINFQFAKETPLVELIKFVQQETKSSDLPAGIPIYVDPAGLLGAEQTLDSPITFVMGDIPLRRSLRLILKQIDMTYQVKDGLLTITYTGTNDPVLTDSFERIGHSLFALLFAWFGGMAATFFYRTRDKAPAS